MASSLLLTDYVGVDRETGLTISGLPHLVQCVRDVVGTFIGSRAMLRDYGSKTVQRMGAPINASTIADVVADTAQALRLWEPRIKVKRVVVSAASADGRLTADLIVQVDGREVRLEGVI